MADAPAGGRGTYQFDFDPDTSYGSAVRLLEGLPDPGLLLDVGCGYGAIAEPLRAAGWTYLGVDVDAQALADLAERGLEGAPVDLDLAADELADRLAEVLADRPVRAIAALDVLEHLKAPEACLGALAAVSGDGVDLVVSLPNVTHVDIAAKLLAGRWDAMDTGLLDRTHRHFFSEDGATRLLAESGWLEQTADDVRSHVTEQADPADLPTVRPDAPLNDLLRAVRTRAGGGGATTYQFVRRYRRGPALAPTAPVAATFATIVVHPGRADLGPLADQLAAQGRSDIEVVVCDPPPGFDPTALATRLDLPGEVVTVAGPDALDAAVRASTGRYVCAIGPDDHVAPTWLAGFATGVERAPGRVLVAGCTDAGGAAVDLARFDLVGAGTGGAVVPAAYAVPRAAYEVGAATLQGPPAEQVAGLARAVLWSGRHDLAEQTCGAAQVTEVAPIAAEVAAHLDREPLLLAPGAAGPLLALHEHLSVTQGALEDARVAGNKVQADLAEHKAHHRAYARAVEVELDDLRTRLASARVVRTRSRALARRIKHLLLHR